MCSSDLADLRTSPMTAVEAYARAPEQRAKLCASGVESWAERDALRSFGYQYFLGTFLSTDVELKDDGTIDPKRLRLMAILNKLRAGELAVSAEIIDIVLESVDVIKAILPRYGRLTVFPAAIPHCGRGVSRICPVARRVLVLKGRPK